MAFKVSYRGNNGAQESIIIDAASRPQLFAELQKRGISAIRVEETTGKPKKAKPSPSTPSARKPSPLRGLLAGLLVISLAVAAWFYLLPTLEHVKAKKDKKPSLIAEVAPEIAEPQPVEEVEQEEPPRVRTRAEILMEGKNTNEWRYVKNPLTGKEYVARVFRPTDQFATKPLYKNQALNELDGILFGNMDDDLLDVMIDDLFMESLTEALINGAEFNEDDDEDTVARKTDMAEALSTISDMLKEGEDVKRVLQDALHEHRKIAAFKDQMKEQRRIMRDEGADESDIEAFEDACNKVLSENGAKPLLTRRLVQERIENLRQNNQEN